MTKINAHCPGRPTAPDFNKGLTEPDADDRGRFVGAVCVGGVVPDQRLVDSGH